MRVRLTPQSRFPTVYRTLSVLEQQGVVHRHAFEGAPARFETADMEHHDHLIDVDTGMVIEFRSDKIERLQAQIAGKLGYDLIRHRLELYCRKPGADRQPIAHRSGKIRSGSGKYIGAKNGTGWPVLPLVWQSRRQDINISWSDFPSSLKADVDCWLTRQGGGDIFDEFGPPKALKPVTIKSHTGMILTSASALVRAGVPSEKDRVSRRPRLARSLQTHPQGSDVRTAKSPPPPWRGAPSC